MKIYLAGPDVFRENAVEYLEGLKKLCKKYGFIGLAPLDNVIEIPDEDKGTPKHSNLIFKANYNLIKECDVIIANIEPFRGACIDDGTAWEIGCGFAFDKRLYGYSPFYDYTLASVTDKFYPKSNVDEYPIVENFGNGVNLMICESIKDSGGSIYKTFEDCLKSLHDFLYGINLPEVKEGDYKLNKKEYILRSKSGVDYIVTDILGNNFGKYDLVFDRECANVPKGYHGELGHIDRFSTDGFATIKLINKETSISDWYAKPLKKIIK